MIKMNKKGTTLGNLYPAVLTIVLIGIILGIGIYVLDSTSDAISTESLSVVNETVATFATAGDAVATASNCGAHAFALTNIMNSTDGVAVPATNYTFTTEGNLYAVAGSPFIGDDINVSYSYTGTSNTATTGACGSISTTSTGVSGLASWIAVIVVVIAAAIVLGIVISSFGKGSSV